jgi:hypothetical protein
MKRKLLSRRDAACRVSCGDEKRRGKPSLLFGGGEENEDFELFLDVVEAMLKFSLDENDGTGAHLGVLGTDLHPGKSSDDVVHLIFAVRFLRIDAAFRQHVDAGAQGRDAQEFEVELVFLGAPASQVVDMEEVGH